MKNPNPKAPLTDAEIRAGIARLMASPLMTSAEGRKGEDGKPDDYTGALEATCDVRTGMAPSLWDLGEKWGLEGNAPGVVEELGLALILHQLTVEELFRAGTSPEAMQLFEKVDGPRAERMKARRAERAAEATS